MSLRSIDQTASPAPGNRLTQLLSMPQAQTAVHPPNLLDPSSQKECSRKHVYVVARDMAARERAVRKEKGETVEDPIRLYWKHVIHYAKNLMKVEMLHNKNGCKSELKKIVEEAEEVLKNTKS